MPQDGGAMFCERHTLVHRQLRGASTAVAVSVALAAAGCQSKDAVWTESDYRAIYGTAIEALRLSAGDSLVLDARPRFLVPSEGEELRMGDFNRYGDPVLSAVIDEGPMTITCQFDSAGSCDRTVHDRFALISEPLPVGGREVLLLAAEVEVDGAALSTRGLVLQLRYGNEGWRVARIWEDHSVRMPRGYSPLQPR